MDRLSILGSALISESSHCDTRDQYSHTQGTPTYSCRTKEKIYGCQTPGGIWSRLWDKIYVPTGVKAGVLSSPLLVHWPKCSHWKIPGQRGIQHHWKWVHRCPHHSLAWHIEDKGSKQGLLLHGGNDFLSLRLNWELREFCTKSLLVQTQSILSLPSNCMPWGARMKKGWRDRYF